MKRNKALGMTMTAALLVTMAGLGGCKTNEPANTNVNTKNVRDGYSMNEGRIRVNSLRDGSNTLNMANGSKHDLRHVSSAQHLADRVAQMPGVKAAHVLRAGNSAYVAVTLEPSGKSNKRSDYTRRGLYGTMGTGSYGIMQGVTGNKNGSMKPYTTSSGEKITRENGYNAVMPGTNGTNEMMTKDDIKQDLKQKIGASLRQADPNLHNVFVSANPDFVQRMGNYAADLKNGRPVHGFMTEMASMFERIFPMHTDQPGYRLTPMGVTPKPQPAAPNHNMMR